MAGNEQFMVTSDRVIVLTDGGCLPPGTTVLYQGHMIRPDGYHHPSAAFARLSTGHMAIVDPTCFPALRFGRFYA